MNYTRAIGFGPALRRAAFAPKPRMFDYMHLSSAREMMLTATSVRNTQVLRSAIHRRYKISVFSIIPALTLSLSTVQTQSLKPEDGTTILNTQRLARPSSPHFTIYQPQLTWIGSIANRITGAGLSVCASILLPSNVAPANPHTMTPPVLYGFSLAYLVAPSTFSSVNIIEFAAGLPEWVKIVEKTVLAAPFAFHSLNGLRHLAWDTGKCLSFSCTILPVTEIDSSPLAQGRIPYRLCCPRCHGHFHGGACAVVERNGLRSVRTTCV